MSASARRRARRVVGGLALLATAGGAHAEPVTYRFDPTHTFVGFEVLHFGTSTIRGRVGPLNGYAVLDRAARTGHVQLEIDTSLASTGVAPLDARLKEADMLAVQANPRAYFVADHVEFDDAGRVTALRGEFTLRGIGQSLTLTARRFACYTSPLFQREVCGGDFEGRLNRSSVGITYSLPFVSDSVRLLVAVEGIRD